jgi:hypothetical protein
MKQYSARAIAHEKSITTKSGQFLEMPEDCSFRCPYQANVINILDMTSRRMVIKDVFIIVKIIDSKRCKITKISWLDIEKSEYRCISIVR